MRRISSAVLLFVMIIGACGCYIPHPSNNTGIRTLRAVETFEKVCTEKVLKSGEKVKRCKWVRSR
jgi:hypothetical protein